MRESFREVSATTSNTSTCVACFGANIEPRGYSVAQRYPLLRCANCGMLFLEINEPDDAAFDAYWGPTVAKLYSNQAVTDELRDKYRRHLANVAGTAPNRRLLDVGSGAGICVDLATREYGLEAMGIEPSGLAVGMARERFGIPVIQGLLGSSAEMPKNFGVLTLWDVIEHVEDPEALVRCCADHLAPGGVFMLETPNAETPLRTFVDWLGSLGWAALDRRAAIYYRAHRYYFTRQSLLLLLERCGFTKVTFREEHTMYQKELRYHKDSLASRMQIRMVAAVTRLLPRLGNKLVVTAVKEAVLDDSSIGCA